MATAPIFLKEAIVYFTPYGSATPTTPVECQVKSAAFVPEEAEIIRYQTLCPTGMHVALGPQYWNLELTGLQAYGSTDDLAKFLFAEAGHMATVTVNIYNAATPTATQPSMRAHVIITPGPYGGEQGTWLESEVVMPCLDTPVLVTSAALLREGLEEALEGAEQGTTLPAA